MWLVNDDYFVAPGNNEIHTQNVECMWSKAKRKIKHMYGTSASLIPSYLAEYMYRRYHKNNMFSSIVGRIRQKYPV
jgi:hypothetical protein